MSPAEAKALLDQLVLMAFDSAIRLALVRRAKYCRDKGRVPTKSCWRRWSREHLDRARNAILNAAVLATAQLKELPHHQWQAINLHLLDQLEQCTRGRGRPTLRQRTSMLLSIHSGTVLGKPRCAAPTEEEAERLQAFAYGVKLKLYARDRWPDRNMTLIEAKRSLSQGNADFRPNVALEDRLDDLISDRRIGRHPSIERRFGVAGRTFEKRLQRARKRAKYRVLPAD